MFSNISLFAEKETCSSAFFVGICTIIKKKKILFFLGEMHFFNFILVLFFCVVFLKHIHTISTLNLID